MSLFRAEPQKNTEELDPIKVLLLKSMFLWKLKITEGIRCHKSIGLARYTSKFWQVFHTIVSPSLRVDYHDCGNLPIRASSDILHNNQSLRKQGTT
jgi:hypothetical protein